MDALELVHPIILYIKLEGSRHRNLFVLVNPMHTWTLPFKGNSPSMVIVIENEFETWSIQLREVIWCGIHFGTSFHFATSFLG